MAERAQPPARRLVIPNLSEHYIQDVRHGMPEGELDGWRQTTMECADMGLFWGGDDKIVVTPRRLDPLHIQDVIGKLRYRNVTNLVPALWSESLCTDVMTDARLLAELCACLRPGPAEVSFWGATPEAYTLLDRLAAGGVACRAPELVPRDAYWTAVYFGSKAGFRETCLGMADRMPGARVAPGYSCPDRATALGAARRLLRQGRGVVVKASYSVGGEGSLVVPTWRLAHEPAAALEGEIRREIERTFYGYGPIVVEEFISQPAGKPYTNPGIDVLIRPDGTVCPMDVAVMLIRDGHYYEGVTYGVIPLPRPLEARILQLAHCVGERLAGAGYRGWFDIDLMVTEDDGLYMAEFNTRRLGDDHVLALRRRYAALTGIARPAAIGEDAVHLGAGGLSYANVRPVIQAVERALPPADFWLVPVFCSTLAAARARLGYAIVAPDGQRALAVRDLFRRRLEDEFGATQQHASRAAAPE